jgi:cAMP-dependent protein kinase regulator
VEALPPLPDASGAVKGKSEFTSAQSRAKEALEKLKKWERAFERDHGGSPTAEDMSSSNTFSSYKRKYKQYVAQMQQLIEEAASADEPAGSAGVGEPDAVASSAPEPATAGSADVARAGAKTPSKRMAVSAESSAQMRSGFEGADFQPAVVPKSKEATAFLNEAARKVLLFSSLSEDEFQTIIGAMFELKASAGQMLISEGEQGDNFYVAQSGSYSVFLKKIPGKAVKTYGPGDSFGELALLYNTPRAASIKCTQSGVLWALDRSTFRVILMSQKQSQDHTMLEFLRQIPLFASLTAEQLVRVASVVNVLKFQGGEHVVRQGDHADSIYLIMEGSVVVMRRGEDVKHPLYRGDFFGESALADEVAETDHKRRADVVLLRRSI